MASYHTKQHQVLQSLQLGGVGCVLWVCTKVQGRSPWKLEVADYAVHLESFILHPFFLCFWACAVTSWVKKHNAAFLQLLVFQSTFTFLFLTLGTNIMRDYKIGIPTSILASISPWNMKTKLIFCKIYFHMEFFSQMPILPKFYVYLFLKMEVFWWFCTDSFLYVVIAYSLELMFWWKNRYRVRIFYSISL